MTHPINISLCGGGCPQSSNCLVGNKWYFFSDDDFYLIMATGES